MAGMFMAIGPIFKTNYTFKKVYVKSIDIKPLLCKILKIPCQSNNMDGKLDDLKEFLNFVKPKQTVNMFSNNYEHNYIYKAYILSLYLFSVIAPVFVTIFNIRRIKYQLWHNIEFEGESVDDFIEEKYDKEFDAFVEVRNEEPKPDLEKNENDIWKTQNDLDVNTSDADNVNTDKSENVLNKKKIITELEFPEGDSGTFI